MCGRASRSRTWNTTPTYTSYVPSACCMQSGKNTADNNTGLNAKKGADLEFCGKMYLPLDTMKQDVRGDPEPCGEVDFLFFYIQKMEIGYVS